MNSRFARLNRQLRHVEMPKGMTHERLSTLSAIAVAGPIAMSTLAERERVRPATMSRMISTLAADGLVRRDYHAADRRRVFVSLTPHGRSEFQKANRYRLERLATALETLPPEQLALMHALAAALETLSEVLNGES